MTAVIEERKGLCQSGRFLSAVSQKIPLIGQTLTGIVASRRVIIMKKIQGKARNMENNTATLLNW